MSAKRPEAKHKIDRRLKVNLWGRAKSPYNNRQYGPGQHGPNSRVKLSGFGTQLQAKQKLKGYYGNVGEKQFAAYYKDAVRLKGDTSQNLIGLLEQRLDAVVYRMKFAPTVFAARQLVSHNHVMVNGKRVNVGSYKIQPGDEIEIREGSKQHQNVIGGLASPERDIPEYLEVDEKKVKGKFIRIPVLEDVPYPVQMEPNLVVEFYSR
ncbi:MAG: 30S ribosomal protein S4 [Alphaproteobacteria bacterium]|nr:MAG: 30S ribosomal protein S4 [Alphaproteobacteria bacterium]